MPNTKNINLFISRESFFNNGKIILHSFSDIEKEFRTAFSKTCSVSTVTRRSKGKDAYLGIEADSLNRALRDCIKDIPEINKETHVENGIFFHSTKEGFDFSIYDRQYNIHRLYNYYLGTIGILHGDEKIINLYKKMNYKKKEWRNTISELQGSNPSNTDLITEKTQLTIAGEFQFGNWALVYRDLFRLLKADINPGVDFYIYVTATGRLSQSISDQTVSYDSALKVIVNAK